MGHSAQKLHCTGAEMPEGFEGEGHKPIAGAVMISEVGMMTISID